jgi:exodeoxyribonuclease III
MTRRTHLTVASINVNGLRAAVRNGMAAWVEQCRPDIVTMQEVRAPDALVPDLVAEVFGDSWHLAHAESAAKGRAGVAIVSRAALVRSDSGDDVAEFSDTGRWVEADIVLAGGRPLTLVSAYAYTGDHEVPERMTEKLAWFDAATARLEHLRADGREVLFTGDLNVAHRDSDLKNWKGNIGAAGCHPDERARFDVWFDQLGWVDVARTLAGDGPVPFTWWSFRGRAFDNDAGWRIDYQIATPGLAGGAEVCRVDRAASYAERWSDHAPLVVTYRIR